MKDGTGIPNPPGVAMTPFWAPEGVLAGASDFGGGDGTGDAGLGENPGAALAALVTGYDPRADGAMIERAYGVAEKAHRNQQRDNGDPYIGHPVAVADRWWDSTLLIAGRHCR